MSVQNIKRAIAFYFIAIGVLGLVASTTVFPLAYGYAVSGHFESPIALPGLDPFLPYEFLAVGSLVVFVWVSAVSRKLRLGLEALDAARAKTFFGLVMASWAFFGAIFVLLIFGILLLSFYVLGIAVLSGFAVLICQGWAFALALRVVRNSSPN